MFHISVGSAYISAYPRRICHFHIHQHLTFTAAAVAATNFHLSASSVTHPSFQTLKSHGNDLLTVDVSMTGISYALCVTRDTHSGHTVAIPQCCFKSSHGHAYSLAQTEQTAFTLTS